MCVFIDVRQRGREPEFLLNKGWSMHQQSAAHSVEVQVPVHVHVPVAWAHLYSMGKKADATATSDSEHQVQYDAWMKLLEPGLVMFGGPEAKPESTEVPYFVVFRHTTGLDGSCPPPPRRRRRRLRRCFAAFLVYARGMPPATIIAVLCPHPSRRQPVAVAATTTRRSR